MRENDDGETPASAATSQADAYMEARRWTRVPETAQSLIQTGIRPRMPRERLRDVVLERLRKSEAEGASRHEAMQELFPNTMLDDAVLESVTAAIISGTNLLLLGPPGSGKTNLARDIWDLYPRDVVVVEGCPVQDDPFSLVETEHALRHPACPRCKVTHGAVSYKELGEFDPTRVDAKKVPVKATRLREGYGLARLQGSPEVFPDYLTGAINLAKLEEIGDPESPLVLEPGKLMQANRGLLLVDEVGKLPRGTQNVLLQALQENVVTPSKSRETFPAAFFAVATSNLEDMDAIQEPLIGRFTSVYVPFNRDHEKNLAIVRRAMRGSHLVVPQLVQEAAVVLTTRWREAASDSPELGEVGSNRTMIDVLARSEAHAMLRGASVVGGTDFTGGAREALMGRVRGRSGEGYLENREAVETFVVKHAGESIAEAARSYWCGFFVEVLKDDKGEGERTGRELRENASPDALRKALGGESGFGKLRRFADYVDAREGKASNDEARLARLQTVLQVFSDTDTFGATKR